MIACGLALVVLLSATIADAALVRVDRVVLRADGGFTPSKLPRHTYEPISFKGRADISSTDSSAPPALQQVRIDLDRDGLLSARGLPVCPPSRIENTTPEEAKRLCGKALVGTGEVRALVTVPGSAPVTVRSPLQLFNGPEVGTVVSHARGTFPSPETYVVVASLEPRSGNFSYRLTVDIPEIADGYGVLTHVDAKIGKRYRAGGTERSYISGRCSDGVFETRGRLTFADGTVIEGSIFKPCTARD